MTPGRDGSACAPGRIDELTRAERDVALLVTEGLTNREVGARLGISERTVDSRLQKIYRKLGLHRRHQLATWVAGQGGPRPEGSAGDRRLPSRRSSLVGRGEELLDVARLARAHRLVTITGPAASGRPGWRSRRRACSNLSSRRASIWSV